MKRLLFITLFIPAAAWAQRPGSSIADDRIFEALLVREGSTVCEIGAGDGDLSIAAARIVGRKGHVYTSELGDDRVKTLRDRVERSGLTHITVVSGDPVKTNFPHQACDALFMRNVYHHFSDPPAMNASIADAVKPSGRVAVIDFSPPRDGSHGVAQESVARQLNEAGFTPVTSAHGAQRWFMVVVSKPT